MTQSSFIGATLLAAFVLFLAAKNHLTNYAAVLWGNTSAGNVANPSSSSGGATGGGLASSGSSALGTAATVAAVALA